MREFIENKDIFSYFDSKKYENSHSIRIDHLINDLNLNQIKNSKIADFGCGDGLLLKRMLSEENKNIFYGLDIYERDISSFSYMKADFDTEFSETFFTKFKVQVDYAFCFEVCEHIPNLYGFICEIKKILKKDGKLFLSIPHESVTHNTLYPGLFYPVSNFYEFLLQMAFEVEDFRVHNAQFAQNVFTLINKDWSYSKMKWHKSEEKFRNISPMIAINL